MEKVGRQGRCRGTCLNIRYIRGGRGTSKLKAVKIQGAEGVLLKEGKISAM